MQSPPVTKGLNYIWYTSGRKKWCHEINGANDKKMEWKYYHTYVILLRDNTINVITFDTQNVFHSSQDH